MVRIVELFMLALALTIMVVSCATPKPQQLGGCLNKDFYLCYQFENMGKAKLSLSAAEYICTVLFHGEYQAKGCTLNNEILECLNLPRDNVEIKTLFYTPWTIDVAKATCLQSGGKI